MFKNYLWILLFTIWIISCTDETIVFEQPQESLFTEESIQVLENSLSYEASGVLDIYKPQEATLGFSKISEEAAGDFPLTLVGRIKAPSLGGRPSLTASHVEVSGDFVYVSYNAIGAEYFGAIDVVNIANPEKIRLVSRLYFSNADISALAYENGNLYAVGGVDSEKSTLATANSLLAKLPIANGLFNLRSGLLFAFQEGFVATDVSVANGKAYVVSGRDGFLNTYDVNELTLEQSIPFQDLRSIAIEGNQLAVLDAQEGIRLLDATTLENSQTFAVEADFQPDHKRTIDILDNKIVVARGGLGAGIYDKNSGALLQEIGIPLNPTHVATTDIVTNATAFNEGAMLMANGGAGLCLSIEDNDIDLVGIIGLEGSINFVESKGDYIFAASGLEGLQIIKMNRPNPQDTLSERCQGAVDYNGQATLQVPQGTSVAYAGNKRLNYLSVAGEALLCGFWTVSQEVVADNDATLEVRGSLFVGRNNKRKDVTIKAGSTLRIEGNLTVYGNLILESGAQLIFEPGTQNIANIFGEVVIAHDATVSGTFKDVQEKF